MSERKPERRGLGRGLSALMADVGLAETVSTATPRSAQAAGVREVPIEQVRPNEDQPRRHFDPEKLNDLTESIKVKGVLQPLLVRERNGYFEIVAGERRWRASQAAKLHNIPVIVRDYSDTEVLEVAIIENIQRAELSPVEEAKAYKQLIERFGHTQELVAESLGKSRSYITNSLRLLTLPQDVIDYVETGELSAGHARALVASDKASTLAKRIVEKGMTVREVERIVREVKTGSGVSRDYKGRGTAGKDSDTIALENDLSANLGMKISISHDAKSGSGVVSIQYKTLEELDALCSILSSVNADG